MKVSPIFSLLVVAALATAACSDSNTDSDGWALDADLADVDAQPDVALDAGPDTAPDARPDVQTDAADAGDTGPPPDVREQCNEDTSGDCDDDGLLDCEEEQLGLEVCDADSDGDGLDDMGETLLGTSPTDPDTDDDGVVDGLELDLGLDPLEPETEPGRPDADHWVVRACDTGEPSPVTYHTNSVGDWRIGLSSDVDGYTDSSIDGADATNRRAAAVYRSSVESAAGFVLSAEPAAAQASPTALLEAYEAALGNYGTLVISHFGPALDTHDDYPYATADFVLRAPAELSTDALRDEVLLAAAPFGRADVSGLPTPAGSTARDFRVRLTAIYRTHPDGSTQKLVLGAVAPAHDAEVSERVRLRLRELTAAANIAHASADTSPGCGGALTRQAPRLDIHWILNPADSMTSHLGRLETAAPVLHDRLTDASSNFRFLVQVPETAGTQSPGSSAGWHTDMATFTTEIDYVISEQRGQFGGPGSLESAESRVHLEHGGYGYSTRRSRLSADVQTITLFVSDQTPWTFREYPLSTSYGQERFEHFLDYLPRYTTAFALVGDGVDCGEGDGSTLAQVARATGGFGASLCKADMERVFERVSLHAVNIGQRVVLPSTPVTGSLRVLVDEQEVPRSRRDGFDYIPETGEVKLFGSARVEPGKAIGVIYESVEGR